MMRANLRSAQKSNKKESKIGQRSVKQEYALTGILEKQFMNDVEKIPILWKRGGHNQRQEFSKAWKVLSEKYQLTDAQYSWCSLRGKIAKWTKEHVNTPCPYKHWAFYFYQLLAERAKGSGGFKHHDQNSEDIKPTTTGLVPNSTDEEMNEDVEELHDTTTAEELALRRQMLVNQPAVNLLAEPEYKIIYQKMSQQNIMHVKQEVDENQVDDSTGVPFENNNQFAQPGNLEINLESFSRDRNFSIEEIKQIEINEMTALMDAQRKRLLNYYKVVNPQP